VVILSALRACDLRDLLAICSLAALVYGISQWSGPAAWVTVGLLGLCVWLRPHVLKG